MQALVILKRFSDRCESALGFNGEYVATLGEINDAIVELEAHKTCKWKDDGYFFDTQCGHHIYSGDNGFEDVDMRDPSFKFCPYCGSVIKRVGELK